MCGQDREARLFGEIGLLFFDVAISQTTQPAEQITDGNNAGELRVANGFAGRMMAGDGLNQFGRQAPVGRDDLAALAMVDAYVLSSASCRGIRRELPYSKERRKSCGDTHSNATIPTSCNNPAA